MKQIPVPSQKRLVTLSQLLSQITNKSKITSTEIASIAGWNEASIRRDISLLELHSGKSNGYNIAELRKSICEKLNLNTSESSSKKCCVVGLGKLGSVFLEKSIFTNSEFEIVAAFDSSSNRIELLRSEIPLFLTTRMETEIKERKIEYAVLCVNDDLAQKYTDKLVLAGIKGIANYTNTILKVPENVVIENMSLPFVLSNISAKVNLRK